MAVQNNDQKCRKFTFEMKLQVGESDGSFDRVYGCSELIYDIEVEPERSELKVVSSKVVARKYLTVISIWLRCNRKSNYQATIRKLCVDIS